MTERSWFLMTGSASGVRLTSGPELKAVLSARPRDRPARGSPPLGKLLQPIDYITSSQEIPLH